MLYGLRLAGEAARLDADRKRRAYVGAIAIRPDGTVVRSRNGAAINVSPPCHAEARLMRKCGAGAEVFVARLTKNGRYANARPCPRCRAAMRARGIRMVTFTVGENSWMSEAIG